MVPMLKKCCCGFSLKVGSLLLGILSSLYAAVLLVGSATIASDPTAVVPKDALGDSEQDAVYAVKAVFTIFALCNVCKLLTSYSLVYGAVHENSMMLLPWLLGHAIILPLYVLLMLPGAIAVFLVGLWGYGLFILLSAVASIGVALYFMIVVYSFYRQLMGEQHVELDTQMDFPPSKCRTDTFFLEEGRST